MHMLNTEVASLRERPTEGSEMIMDNDSPYFLQYTG